MLQHCAPRNGTLAVLGTRIHAGIKYPVIRHWCGDATGLGLVFRRKQSSWLNNDIPLRRLFRQPGSSHCLRPPIEMFRSTDREQVLKVGDTILGHELAPPWLYLPRLDLPRVPCWLQPGRSLGGDPAVRGLRLSPMTVSRNVRFWHN